VALSPLTVPEFYNTYRHLEVRYVVILFVCGLSVKIWAPGPFIEVVSKVGLVKDEPLISAAYY
jgi:hypothetical protein